MLQCIHAGEYASATDGWPFLAHPLDYCGSRPLSPEPLSGIPDSHSLVCTTCCWPGAISRVPQHGVHQFAIIALTYPGCTPSSLGGPPLLICLMLQAPAGQPPDVSARLLRICDMADDDS